MVDPPPSLVLSYPQGLTTDEALRRVEIFGLNALEEKHINPILQVSGVGKGGGCRVCVGGGYFCLRGARIPLEMKSCFRRRFMAPGFMIRYASLSNPLLPLISLTRARACLETGTIDRFGSFPFSKKIHNPGRLGKN